MNARILFSTGLASTAFSGVALGQAPPETIEVTGIVRDFRERTAPDGHSDMEMRPDHGFAMYSGNIGQAIGPDRKPVFVGGGNKVNADWLDSDNRPICYALYDASLGDVAGSWGASDSGGVASGDSFSQWYRDLPGVNLSQQLTLQLVLQDDGQYVFDDQLDEDYSSLGGFFPIEDQLFGNPGGSPDRNFHFTFELHMQFEYDADGDQYFKFIGDDDVFVFINDELVIDLGGVHSARSQYVDLNRLELADGETYLIDFFFAERHRTQSNFRIETNLPLQTAGLPSVSVAYD